ncbi:dihydropteroate synthase [Candidatus Peregrinibacteria bacterium]|nr:dihydropteroate synthase [Candidatus Peregrinibacteria bacterium]MBT7736113.1 dihydropteroate synthase [Candidatus Peregrinibacteria bacterium]
MGIINVTPDSFSDGGKFNTLRKALKQGKKLEKDGADIIDIGGESTGPESKDISEREELKRVIPVIEEIKKQTNLPISIDTYKSSVAEAALQSGASIINDVTALRGDSKMVRVAHKHQCPVIMMYSKDNTPRTTVKNKHYKDVIEIIKDFFKERMNYIKKHSLTTSQIILDPGMGQFISAIPKYSYEIISKLKELDELKAPLLLGISRKSFLGGEVSERLEKGLLISGIAYLNGASILRTHDVKETKEFFKKF